MKQLSAFRAALLIAVVLVSPCASAWDYDVHRAINQLALASLPTNFPAFVRTPAAAERIGFLAGEMDRWRNTPDLPLKHVNNPEHYLDVEELAAYGLDPEQLPIFRYDLVESLALIRKAKPEKFSSDKGEDHTAQLPGFLPWALAENCGKLKSGFSYLKAYQEDGGTPEEIANAEANIVYIMGVMGHLAGDASQPLHTTVHHHGWVGTNPNGYTTNRSIHSWIDGGYFQKTGGADVSKLRARLRPAQLPMMGDRPARAQETFKVVMRFVLEQHKQMEPLYRLEKEGKLSGSGEKGLEGRAFLEGQLLKSGQLLGDLWLAAWQQAPPDSFLKGQLAKRRKE